MMHFFGAGQQDTNPPIDPLLPFNPQRIHIQNKKLGRRRRPYGHPAPTLETIESRQLRQQHKKKIHRYRVWVSGLPSHFLLGHYHHHQPRWTRTSKLMMMQTAAHLRRSSVGKDTLLTQFVCFRKRNLLQEGRLGRSGQTLSHNILPVRQKSF